ncbi:MAG: PspC domain-containing protein [Gemmatimonadales bacterium]|jgi:phage shock protein C
MPEDGNFLWFPLSLALLVLAIALLLAGLHMTVRLPIKRSRGQRIIAGVCGGLADMLGWDVRVVRGLYVLASVSSAAFPGILVYIVLWVLMPED